MAPTDPDNDYPDWNRLTYLFNKDGVCSVMNAEANAIKAKNLPMIVGPPRRLMNRGSLLKPMIVTAPDGQVFKARSINAASDIAGIEAHTLGEKIRSKGIHKTRTGFVITPQEVSC